MTGKVGDVRQAVSNDASWIQVSTLSWILQGKQRIRAIVMELKEFFISHESQ